MAINKITLLSLSFLVFETYWIMRYNLGNISNSFGATFPEN